MQIQQWRLKYNIFRGENIGLDNWWKKHLT